MKFCDEKTPLVKDWAYYINWVVEDQILLSAQKQTQNRLETQIRLKKQVGTRCNDNGIHTLGVQALSVRAEYACL